MNGPLPEPARQTTRVREPSALDRLEHDVRQSLCAMTAILDVLRQDPLSQPQVLTRLELIRRESEWMARVVADATPSGHQPVDTGEVVESTWRVVAVQAPCPVRLVREPVPVILADPVCLGRAVRNLLDNAVRAAGPDGAVEVRVRSRGGRVVVQVADTGPGFGQIPRVHGYGLATVRQVVGDLDGRLLIGRDALGGAQMTMELPAALLGQVADPDVPAEAI